MQITDEVTAEESLKCWFWIGRNQGNQSDSSILWISMEEKEIDEALFTLGKARYYDQRFIP
jgi:hypothetical protein